MAMSRNPQPQAKAKPGSGKSKQAIMPTGHVQATRNKPSIPSKDRQRGKRAPGGERIGQAKVRE